MPRRAKVCVRLFCTGRKGGVGRPLSAYSFVKVGLSSRLLPRVSYLRVIDIVLSPDTPLPWPDRRDA
jgi:hypothetical protein